MIRPLACVLAVLQFILPGLAAAAPIEKLPAELPSASIPALPAVAVPGAIPDLNATPALPSALPLQAAAPAVPASPIAAANALAAEAKAATPAQSAEGARGQGEAVFAGARRAAAASAPGEPVLAADAGSAGSSGLAPSAPSASADAKSPRAPSELPPDPPGFFQRHDRLARALMWPLLKLFYRVERAGEALPPGPAIIVPNHVSYVDAIMLSYAAKRPMRFMIFRPIYEGRGFPRAIRWVVPLFFRSVGGIPIASPAEGGGRKAVEEAIARARAALKSGETVAIFPEGALTRTGNMAEFKRGFEKIAADMNVPVVPAHLDNLWGSWFSRRGVTLRQALGEVPRVITVRFGKPLEQVDAQAARVAVQELSAASEEARVRRDAETLPRAFVRRAKRFWKNRALADSTGKDLSFGETLTGAVALSRALSPKLGKGQRVAVLIPPSAGGALANVSLSMLGRVPVNLNYSVGEDATKHGVALAELDTLVTSRVALEKLKSKVGYVPPAINTVYLEDLIPAKPTWRTKLLYVALRVLPRSVVSGLFLRQASRKLDDTAAIMMTSGSTSLPKGVELTHLNFQTGMDMISQVYSYGPGDTMLGVLPFFHVMGLTVSVWYPLLHGIAAAYHASPLDFGTINKLAQKVKPTIMLGTPSLLQKYVDVPKITPAAFSSLRSVIAGAEALKTETADAFEKKFGTRPYEGFGATETSAIGTISVPDAGGQKGSKAGSVGQNLPGTAMKVVDVETGAPLPYGQSGRLLFKGPNVMKGYLNAPEKTAKVLKDGWYDTGDMARLDKDGFPYLEGRVDIDFGKIAGEMVPYLGVADRLQQASGLSEPSFVVAGVADPKRGNRLVVLYKGELDVNALLTKAKEQGLPNLWTPAPSDFFRVEEFPLLGTGKLDKRGVIALAEKLAAGKR